MVVFGGVDGGAALADLWALDFAPTAHWERLQPGGTAPDARAGMGMGYDSDSLRILVAGGTGSYFYPGFSDERWSLDLVPAPRWRRLIAGQPYYSSSDDPMG